MSPALLQEAITLYDRFTHETLDRRAFMAELTRLAGSAAAAGALLASISACHTAAPVTLAGDTRLETANVSWQTAPGRTMSGYRAAPADARRDAPAIIVIHENRGLSEHIRDVARRAANAGYVALAPDFLSPAGGTPADEDRAREMIGALDMSLTTADAVSTAAWLRSAQGQARRVGAVGFCWGGAMVNRLAASAGEGLHAGVSFYGPAPDPAEASRVRAAMLIILAGLDERVNRTGIPWVEALRTAGKEVEMLNYPGVNHAFHNDTSQARYNNEAAMHAWAATLGFFDRHLQLSS